MSGVQFLALAADASLGVLALAVLLALWRMALGPGAGERVLALHLLFALGVGIVAVAAVRGGTAAYLDIAVALGLTGFLPVAALARFARRRPGGKARR